MRYIKALHAILFIVFSLFCDAKTAQEMYKQHCQTCHGSDLTGGLGSALNDGVWKFGATDAAIASSIKNGIPTMGMPPWNTHLTDQDIRALVIYLREQEHKYRISDKRTDTPLTPPQSQTKFYSLRSQKLHELPGTIWSINLLNEEKMIATLKKGDIYIIENNKINKVKGTPKVWHYGQGGLLDIASYPSGVAHPWIYISYAAKAKASSNKGMTAIARGKIINNQWTNTQVIFQTPSKLHLSSGYHFGSRIAFQDKYLYFSIGDRGNKDMSQDLSKPNGKIHRLYLDGRIPKDNPFIGNKNAIPSIWSYGHRNPQGLDYDIDTGILWSTEHGPRGGDEVNIIHKAGNYGWPQASYGMNYNGTPMNVSTHVSGTLQPEHYWVPSIATAGTAIYRGNAFPKWKHNLLVSGLKSRALHRLTFSQQVFISEEIMFQGIGRVRDVAQSPSGRIYFAVNKGEDKLSVIYEIIKHSK